MQLPQPCLANGVMLDTATPQSLKLLVSLTVLLL